MKLYIKTDSGEMFAFADVPAEKIVRMFANPAVGNMAESALKDRAQKEVSRKAPKHYSWMFSRNAAPALVMTELKRRPLSTVEQITSSIAALTGKPFKKLKVVVYGALHRGVKRGIINKSLNSSNEWIYSIKG